MLHSRFKFSSQTLLLSSVSLLLLYVLFTVIQPVGSALGAALLQATGVSKTVPPYLNYQGTLRDAEGKTMSGAQKLTFRIYKDVTAPLPEALWMEEHNQVTVRDGHFSVLLGNNKPIPPELFTGPDFFIGVTVAPFDEMVPRQRFASAPYAMYADHAAALTAPGSSTHAVHVDPTGRVGVGNSSPQAQLHISVTTGSALQVNAGGQQMVVNPSGLGIGTNAPAAPLHIRGDDPDTMLDLNSASANPRSEYTFGVDGQRRASVYYDKSTNKVGIEHGNTQLNLYNDGWIETVSNLGVNGELHARTKLWVNGDFAMGPYPGRKPVRIHRFNYLPEDQEFFDTGISAHIYQCTTGAWSTGKYDMSEDSRDADMVWLYIGENSNWQIHVKFMSDGQPDETPHVDVLCFLNGLVEYTEEWANSRWIAGE